MAPSRGTDFATEERQLRPREEKDALGKWLDALFYATTEVILLSLPLLGLVMVLGDVELTFVTIVALTVLVFGVGLQRHRPVGPPWPKMSPLLGVVRLILYNVALAGGVVLGRILFSEPLVGFAWVREPLVGPSLVASAIVLVPVIALPYLAVLLGRLRTA